jgi:membrane-associated phospholipid phosphatase
MVTEWVEIELSEIASHRTNPPRSARGLALLSVALLDASKVPRGLRAAATAGAAAAVLAYLYPDRAAEFQRLAERKRPPVGLVLGRRIGARVVDDARDDGSDTVWHGTAPVGPGVWAPTPPAFTSPLEPLAGTWRTWNIRSGSSLRPAAPPTFGSSQYLSQVREVYDVSRALTNDQRRIAEQWADGVGTVTPAGHWNLIAVDLIRSHGLGVAPAARVLATLNTAQADAFIACWDAKFSYWTERPITAIRRELDASWLPYITTPPFPSYVSGHATTSGAASEILAAHFREAAPRLRAWAAEAAASRLYGGIHFRGDNEAGLALGKQVATAAIARYGVAPVEPGSGQRRSNPY